MSTPMSARKRMPCLLGNPFLRQPGGVLKGLLNVFSLQVGISLKNLLDRGAIGNLTDDHGHRDAHSTNTRPAAQDLSLKGNSLKHGVSPLSINMGSHPL